MFSCLDRWGLLVVEIATVLESRVSCKFLSVIHCFHLFRDLATHSKVVMNLSYASRHMAVTTAVSIHMYLPPVWGRDNGRSTRSCNIAEHRQQHRQQHRQPYQHNHQPAATIKKKNNTATYLCFGVRRFFSPY